MPVAPRDSKHFFTLFMTIAKSLLDSWSSYKEVKCLAIIYHMQKPERQTLDPFILPVFHDEL